MTDERSKDNAEAAPPREAPEEANTSREPGAFATLFLVIFGFAFWAVLGLLVASIWSTRAWTLARTHWLWLVATPIASLVLFGLVRAAEAQLERIAPASRRTVVAFAAIPLVALVVTGIVFLDAAYRTFVLQVVLILVASLAPAGLYYLFLHTRRSSILNEFLGNLGRLGLLERHRAAARAPSGDEGDVVRGTAPREESMEEAIARVNGYLRRFEALFGTLRFTYQRERDATTDEFVRALMAAVEDAQGSLGAGRTLPPVPTAAVHLGDMFRANLVIPLGLTTLLCALGWLLVLQPEWITPAATPAPQAAVRHADGVFAAWLRVATPAPPAPPAPAVSAATGIGLRLSPLWTPVNFAFLGAYLFGLQAIFRRFTRRDLGPNAYLGFATRILIAVVGAWVTIAAWQVATAPADALAVVVREPREWPASLLLLAFVVGVFPSVLWRIIGAVLSKLTYFGRLLPSVESRLPLSDLDGLTVWHESRLEEEDVENVPSMASADVVDLMLHTQIPAERLVAWIDQAILYTVLGPAQDGQDAPRTRLRSHGMRNATELVHCYACAGNGRREELAGLLNDGNGGGPLPSIVCAIQVEANFELVRAWRGV